MILLIGIILITYLICLSITVLVICLIPSIYRIKLYNELDSLSNKISLIISQQTRPIANIVTAVSRYWKTLQMIPSNEKMATMKPMKQMLDEGILPDAVIKTKTDDFPCHKFVLASYSEYFQALFQPDNNTNQNDRIQEQRNVVNWVDVYDSDTVKDLLHFMYTRQTPPNIRVTFPSLLEVADKCLMEELKRICSEALINMIDIDTAGSILEVAEKYQLQSLRKKAVLFIRDHYDKVLETPGFENIHMEIKSRLLKNVFQLFGETVQILKNSYSNRNILQQTNQATSYYRRRV